MFMTVQTVAATMATPDMKNISGPPSSSPATLRRLLKGSTQKATNNTPVAVKANRSAVSSTMDVRRSKLRAISPMPKIAKDTPILKGPAWSEAVPTQVKNRPNIRASQPCRK